jgi:hypothetical protein
MRALKICDKPAIACARIEMSDLVVGITKLPIGQ